MSYIYSKPSIIDFGRENETVTIKVSADSDSAITISVPDWVTPSTTTLTLTGTPYQGSFTVRPTTGVLTEKSSTQIILTGTTSAETSEIQAIYSYDATLTPIDEIIDDMMLQSTYDDYLKPMSRHQLRSIANKGIRMFSFDGMQKRRMSEFYLDDTGRIDRPFDMVKLLKAYYVDSNGFLVQIYTSDNMNRSYTYVQDEDSYLVTDQNGYVLESEGLTPQISKSTSPSFESLTSEYSDYYRLNDYRLGGIYGMQGGKESYAGKHAVDEVGGQIIFADVPTDYIVLEYLSDPIILHNQGLSMGKLSVHKFFRQAMESYIYWNAIKRRSRVPMNEKQRAEREYYNEFRLARRRMVDMEAVYQALKTRFKYLKF